MSLTTHEPRSGAGTPTRPSSAWTNNSVFADSAISLRTGTPAPAEKELDLFHADDGTSSRVGFADRLNGLVSEIWACEQDGAIRREKSHKFERAIQQIEAALDDDSSGDSDLYSALPSPATMPTDPATVSEDDFAAIRASLACTVESMRMRQQEQRHLHQLAVEKLETVAQRCIQQERRLKEFAQEMVLLKQENRLLNEELNQAHTESAKKHVAVDAMSSAVAGLEGWINGTPTPDRSDKRVVIRGRGRFRGRYYADEPMQAPVGQGSDGTSDAKAFHEGVTAWLRGFRDVEEELRMSQKTKAPGWRESQNPATNTDDEWGDFESATGT
ncbi:hypothetical protein EDD37DRAFT_698 [Exophiala viscosa]|uniref:Uncharacterized protein n=1 Tax=Exophiala viscosa TaxID=2486360 RepID=A0AAN6DKF0_9EURO|nr:hypothetical protein EDD36DRAFT_116504 [Exophiala viscosa]KAI1628353.1 hypothetical protein EDD37DRAFT_698 [Exophiala viscosa]